MSDSIYELAWSSVIAVFIVMSFSQAINKKRPISISLIAFWVAGLNISMLPWLSYLIDENTFFFDSGFRSVSLYLIYFLFLFGIWVTTLFSRQQKVNQFRVVTEVLANEVKFTVILSLILISYLLRTIDIVKYGGGMSGLATLEYQLAKPYALVVAQSLVGMFRMVIIFWLFYHAERKLNLITLLILFEVGSTFVAYGRRELLVLVVLFFFVRYLKNNSLGFKQVISGLLVASLVSIYLFPAFLTFRDGYIQSRSMGLSTMEYFDMGIENLSKTYTVLDDVSRVRISSRLSGTSSYIRQILNQQEHKSPMYGEAFLRYFSVTIPRVLYPDKPLEHPEAHITRHYAIYVGDPSTTVASAGVADFGVGGALIAGIFVGLIFGIGQKLGIVMLIRSPLIGSAIFLNFLYIALNYETATTTYFSAIRDSLVLIMFYFFIRVFLKKKMRWSNYFDRLRAQ